MSRQAGASVMRLHPEPGSKWYRKGPHWRVCDDTACLLEHVDWKPGYPIVASLKCDPRAAAVSGDSEKPQ